MRLYVLVLIGILTFNAVARLGYAIEISEPVEGSQIPIGTTVRIVVKPATGETWKAVYFGFDPIEYDAVQHEYIKKVPVLPEADIGATSLKILAIDGSGKEFELTRTVYINLPSNVKLESLKVRDDQKTLFMRVGSKRKIFLYGKFSDGVERKMFAASRETTYKTIDEKIASVSDEGLVTAINSGQAKVIITNGDKKLEIGVSIKPRK